jgi:hypothetical protein
MNKSNLYFRLVVSALVFTSCGGETIIDSAEQESSIDTFEEEGSNIENSTGLTGDLGICIAVHNAVLPEELPYTEATNFENYEPLFPLMGEEIRAFQLSNLGLDTSAHVNLAYWAEFSEDYLTYIFNVMPSESEVTTYMVSYEQDFVYIDHVQIAFDEIAEGFVVEESVITASEIQKIKRTYFDEEEVIKSTITIDAEGKFVEK